MGRRIRSHVDIVPGLLGAHSGTLLQRSPGLDGGLVIVAAALEPPPSGGRNGR